MLQFHARWASMVWLEPRKRFSVSPPLQFVASYAGAAGAAGAAQVVQQKSAIVSASSVALPATAGGVQPKVLAAVFMSIPQSCDCVIEAVLRISGMDVAQPAAERPRTEPPVKRVLSRAHVGGGGDANAAHAVQHEADIGEAAPEAGAQPEAENISFGVAEQTTAAVPRAGDAAASAGMALAQSAGRLHGLPEK